jgi:hypothetical protein
MARSVYFHPLTFIQHRSWIATHGKRRRARNDDSRKRTLHAVVLAWGYRNGYAKTHPAGEKVFFRFRYKNSDNSHFTHPTAEFRIINWHIKLLYALNKLPYVQIIFYGRNMIVLCRNILKKLGTKNYKKSLLIWIQNRIMTNTTNYY